MSNNMSFYVDGQWVAPAAPASLDVINPATEDVAGQISLGSAADVDRAVAAARRAFPAYSSTGREERLALLQRIIEGYEARIGELARAMTAERGVQHCRRRFHFRDRGDLVERGVGPLLHERISGRVAAQHVRKRTDLRRLTVESRRLHP